MWDKEQKESRPASRVNSEEQPTCFSTYGWSFWDCVGLQAKLQILGFYAEDFFAKDFINT